MSDHPGEWDALDRTQRLQDAVVAHDRDSLDGWVSAQMIWVMPLSDNTRGKQEWIEASCSITWDWFDVRISREIDLGNTRLVDIWTLEDGDWRLTARHPQRAEA